jgi:hypothetical protein
MQKDENSTRPAERDAEGWVLVPREPVEAMLDAYWKQTGESELMRLRTHSYMRRYWSAMLSALPTSAQDSTKEPQP